MRVRLLVGFLVILFGGAAEAEFGFTSNGNSYSVDTNGGLTFDVNKKTGDVTSLKYKDVEYQSSHKNTQINSGLGTSEVTAENVEGYVKITIKAGSQPVTHYLVVKPDDPTLYMATYITGEVDPGELRWLARLNRSEIPDGWHGDVGVLDGCTAFEGKDTFKCPNGETRCKMYTSDRFIDDKVHGVTGKGGGYGLEGEKGVGVWMIMPGVAYETSSGGPFMRDINSQSGDDQELYWYMNSGHVRTEPWRFGLMGPYAMRFTTGEQPSAADVDTSFFEKLSIEGYVPNGGRGRISGKATGIPNVFEVVLHWHNDKAQYWAKATDDGNYTSPLMKPGTYTMKMYRGEFPVAEESVTITAGTNATKDIQSTEKKTSLIWRVGNLDGKPLELKNGDRIERMHPDDVRSIPWGGNITLGYSSSGEFPMALFAKVGGTGTINFNLAADQVVDVVLRVSTTLSFKGGRPSVKMNDWEGKDPGAPKLIDSRGVTRGAYRGYGEMYSWDIPASALREGRNAVTLGVFGSGDQGFLSANYIIDAVELQGPKGADSPASWDAWVL